MPDAPLLSVAVCTHDRPRDLERCLAALARLQDPVDVVVVDSASREPVGEVVERFAGAIPHVRTVREERPGLSRARNAGVAAAACEIVAFIDDDAAPAPDWARRLAAAFHDPGIAAAGGTCRPVFERERPRWLSDRLLQFAGITRFGGEARDARSSAEYPFGANMAFRRDALERAGGFSEALGRTGRSLLSGEELEAFEMVRAAGGRIRLVPDAVVDHLVVAERCESGYYWRRLWWQGVSRARARRSIALGLRLAAAAGVRLGLWVATRDRVHLYRVAETAGYVATALRPRSAP